MPGVNVAALIGHSALRLATMSDIRVKASDAEIGAMIDHAEEAMENGAAGFSTGLFYPTNAAADIDEVSRVAARFAKHGGVYATHMRSEMEPILDSIEETLATARRADIPVVISHHKCAGPKNWGRTRETLPVIEAAAKRQPVGLDAYPYTAGSTNLRADLVTDEYPDHDHLVAPASGGDRPRPERHRGRMGRRPPRGGAAARSGRRDLFPDERGGRGARAALSADHDRLGRPAA